MRLIFSADSHLYIYHLSAYFFSFNFSCFLSQFIPVLISVTSRNITNKTIIKDKVLAGDELTSLFYIRSAALLLSTRAISITEN